VDFSPGRPKPDRVTTIRGVLPADSPTIAPNTAPGGLVFRISAGGLVHMERSLAPGAPPDLLAAEAAADGAYALRLADRYGEARLHIYDGDTGECISTLVTR